MDIIALIQAVPGVGPWLPYILVVFGICAVVAAQLPPPATPGSVYDMLYRLANVLGQNYNQARNATSAPVKADSKPPLSSTTLVVLAALVAPLILSACSSAGSSSSSDVAALEATLTAAEDLGAAYIRLPHCTGTNGPLCSDSAIVAHIKTSDAQAYALVKAAEQVSGDPSALAAAEAAVTALTVITNTLPKQGS